MVFASSVLAFASLAVLPADAEIIYRGGSVITINDAQPTAEAVAVSDGKIIAVGTEAEVMKFKGGATKVVDLAGKTLIPGFVDAHGHAVMGGLQALSANLLAPPDGEVQDIPGIIRTLNEWIKANPAAVKKANVIIGFGYDQSQLKEQRHPTRDDLDKVSKDVPVMIIHQSGHLGSLNSKALQLVGYSASTKNPAGGVIQRKPGSQEPNGVLEETAFISALPKVLGSLGSDAFDVFAKAGTELWARFGYTTAQEGRSNAVIDAALGRLASAGGLKVDVVSYPDILLGKDHIQKNVSMSYKNRLRIGGAKLTIDGSPQGFTAWRDRPYYDPVGDYPPGYLGYPAATAEQVFDAVKWCYQNNIQLLVHSNGEAASDQLIAAIGAAQKEFGARPIRPVLIHGQFLREDQVDAYVKLGVIPSLFPMHTFYWGDWHREHTVGPELAENISPTGWFRKRGSIFTSHHDAPVAFPNSMRVLDATVTRRSRSGDILGPAQRVDVLTGLKAMTLWPAYQHFEEATKGSIEVGKLADFAVLSKNAMKIDPETIDTISIDETIKEGVTIYKRDGSADSKNEQQSRLSEAMARSFYGMADLMAGHDHEHENHKPEVKGKLNPMSCTCSLFAVLTDALARGSAPRRSR